MLSAGRALMASSGYCTSFDAHHLGVVRFCAAVLSSDASHLASVFNRYRARRHEVVYGEAGSVGRSEAANAIENSRKFVALIKGRLK